MTGSAIGAVERRAIGSEFPHAEALSADAVFGPESLLKISSPKGQHIKGKLIDLLLCQAQLWHIRALHHRSGSAEMLFEPVGECSLASDLSEIKLPRIFISLGC